MQFLYKTYIFECMRVFDQLIKPFGWYEHRMCPNVYVFFIFSSHSRQSSQPATSLTSSDDCTPMPAK